MDEQTVAAIQRRNALRLAYKRLFSSEDGVMVLEDMKRSAGYGETMFEAGKPDVTAFRLGRQDIVNNIIRVLNSKTEESDVST